MKYFKLLCIVAALAVFIAGFSAFFAIQIYTQSQTAMEEAGLNAVEVVTLNKDVNAYTQITADMISTVSLPKKAVTTEAISNPAEVVGKMPVTSLREGTQLTASMLLGETDTGVLSYAVTPGSTAITIAVNEESGMSQMINQGDYVDIISSTDEGSNIIVTGLKVIALGNSVSPYTDQAEYGTITLEVTREQATRIDAAEKRGSLRFIMSDVQQGTKDTISSNQNTNTSSASTTPNTQSANTNTNTATGDEIGQAQQSDNTENEQ